MPYPAMALGTSEATPIQIASAYTAFAANGTRTAPLAIARITTGTGTTIAQPTAQKNEVVRPGRIGLSHDFNHEGRGEPRDGRTDTRRAGFQVQRRRQNRELHATVGLPVTHPNLVCVVWVGFDDGSQIGA